MCKNVQMWLSVVVHVHDNLKSGEAEMFLDILKFSGVVALSCSFILTKQADKWRCDIVS